jgi:imidazolonepropionase-like amidohydrolase
MNEADNQNSRQTAQGSRWDTLLVDVNLATMADPASFGIIENAALGMKDGRIVGLGPMASLPDTPDKLAVDVIECGNVWVTPGLIDCHTHLLSNVTDNEEQSLALSIKWLLSLMKEGVTTLATMPAIEADSKNVDAIGKIAQKLEDNYPVYIYPDIADTQALVSAATKSTDIEAMERAKKVGVLLPATYYLSGENKTPPLDLLRQHKVAMALATGCNPQTMPVTSILLVLNMACRLFGLTPEEALHGLTTQGALAMGVADDVGMLTSGKLADLALWDINHPAELSYHLGHNPCLGVFKGGVLYKVEG